MRVYENATPSGRLVIANPDDWEEFKTTQRRAESVGTRPQCRSHPTYQSGPPKFMDLLKQIAETHWRRDDPTSPNWDEITTATQRKLEEVVGALRAAGQGLYECTVGGCRYQA